MDKMESKTQRNARLKAMRKKYGLGEFKNSKRKVYKVAPTKKNMVKRRSSKRRSYSRKGSSFNVWNSLIGVGGVVAYKGFLSQYIPLSTNVKTIAEIGVGIWLSKKGGIIGNVAKTLVIIDVYHLMSQYLAPMMSGLSATNVNNGGITFY